jgi:hypothetical protein
MRFWLLVLGVSLSIASVFGCSEEPAPAPEVPINATAQKSDPPPPPPPPPPPEATATVPEPSKKAIALTPKTMTAFERPAVATDDESEKQVDSESKDQPEATSNPKSDTSITKKPLVFTPGKSESKPYSPPFGKASAASQDRKSNDAEPIQLSLGVSLPQTGPEGILMSFSVDYEMQIEPSKTTYVLVIEREQGKPAKIERKLSKKKDRLVAIISGWRPEEGPFQAHLEDNKGKRLSNNVVLLSSGE